MSISLETAALVDGLLLCFFYLIVFIFTITNNCLRFGKRFKMKHFENKSCLGPRIVFRIGNYFTILDGLLMGIGCLIYYGIGVNSFNFYMYYELLDIGCVYGILFTFFFTITTVKNQLSRLLPNNKSSLTKWFDGINSFNIGFSVCTIVSNIVLLVYCEILWQYQGCFVLEASYTSTIFEIMFGFESSVHFLLCGISMIFFILHLHEIFKTFIDVEFKKIKRREMICSFILVFSFFCRCVFNLLFNGIAVTRSEVLEKDVYDYHRVYEDYRNQFLNGPTDWFSIIVTAITPLVTMQMMVDYPF
ncbi:hypothetical protein EDI_085800 [Entamoeba dispar SAW760]|uniref:Uncharacterized protein n=1 Tax=Entamoeba dispar (strain ATCC PRA-260 / SAW760) TaxID=370354 RepID=B0EF29_ENTDS|nr:uncharacterized protein EDI_085800 [Entamoeba dispar SAW760]EDR26878.1 hypothetical protein EDI_085800 [Entamoeba dispar SAW760]|eukprot:EDR26878.1 hypothetical protein EDI_085800 [Entamoeba dispar SAW760]